MVKMPAAANSPSSPVKITVTSSGGSRSIGLTSPMPRYSISNNPNSPISGGRAENRRSSGGGGRFLSVSKDSADEFVAYTVQIPSTPDDSQNSPPISKSRSKNFIKDTTFTGGFNSATKAHVRKSSEEEPVISKSKTLCATEGCDENAIEGKFKNYCDCGFGICHDCYLDCVENEGGYCPGCKEPYKDVYDRESEDEPLSEAKDQANPLPSWSKGVKLEKNLSLVQSFKNPNHEFDHNKWLFETNGTYGYGNALWPKEGYEFERGAERHENLPDFSSRNKPLTRKLGISAAVINPYRLLIILRLGALGLFLTWRIMHPNHEAMWLWIMSIVCEVWFAFSWILDQLPKLCPVKRVTDLTVLNERFESSEPNLRNPKKFSDLPGIDVFVSTADAEKEPPLTTANTILSILAVDYPVEKVACYLSDDGGSLVTFEALAEAASFARVWVPFCRKHKIEPRNPEAYFAIKRDPLKNKVKLDFVKDRRRVKREYDEYKVRINALPESIRRRSDAYNAQAELRAKRKQVELGLALSETVKIPKATWMTDGNHWHGTWSSGEEGHSRGDHEGIIQIMLVPASPEPLFGNEENLIDTTEVDIRLPMLVYMSREKRPAFDHNKKAGAMNALVRASAIMSNGAFILNLDCDHYIYNSLAIKEGMCFMLDRGGDKICYVQFPQRFEGIDPNDRYANHNTVFFDVNMRALDGLQGPMYVGTGCIFRRVALYGFSPPRATEHHGWLGRKKNKKLLTSSSKNQEEDDEMLLPVNGDQNNTKKFGNSTTLIDSISVAEFGGRLLHEFER